MGVNVNIETIKVYKGAQSVTVNKSDAEEWKDAGWKTSSDRQKASKKKDEPKAS